MKNLEEKRGKPARIVLGDPLPDEVEILPTADVLTEGCAVDRVDEGVEAPPPADGYDEAEIDRLEALYDEMKAALGEVGIDQEDEDAA